MGPALLLLAALAADPPAAAPAPTQTIDLEVENAQIRDVLRLIGEVGHLNFVLDDAVKGTVTVSLRDVPWDQALAAILASKGLVAVPFGEDILLVQPGG